MAGRPVTGGEALADMGPRHPQTMAQYQLLHFYRATGTAMKRRMGAAKALIGRDKTLIDPDQRCTTAPKPHSDAPLP